MRKIKIVVVIAIKIFSNYSPKKYSAVGRERFATELRGGEGG